VRRKITWVIAARTEVTGEKHRKCQDRGLVNLGDDGNHGNSGNGQRRFARLNPTSMVWTIVIALVVLWAIGFGLHVAGSMIHALLVIAFCIVFIHLLTGRKLA